MNEQILLVAVPLSLLGAMLLWQAYLIQYKGRVDLVRLGSRPLPGAGILKKQFAVAQALSGIACLLTSLTTLAAGEFSSPTAWIFAAAMVALSIWRHVLIRAIEIRSRGAAVQ